MKKICFVTTVHLTLEAFIMEVAEYIHQNNVEIYFICNYNEEFEMKLPRYIHFYPVKMSRGIDLSAMKSIWSMYKIFKEEKFDLVQYATPNASLYASIASTFAGIKNRLYAQWGMYYVGLNGIKRKLFKLIEKITCKFSTHVQSISPLNREFGVSEGLYTTEKSSVIGIGSVKGVDFNRFDIYKKSEYRNEIRNRYSIDEGDFVFGYVARITKDKGINETLEAFKEFQNIHSNVKLIICGDEDPNSNVNHELLDWAKTNSNVLIAGFVNNAEKFFAAMDVFLFPTYREGFGEVSLESQSMGTPVITTNVPGPSESVKEGVGGIHINPKDTKALYKAMEQMYNNSGFLLEMSKNAPVWVKENFNSEKLIKKICEFKIKMIEES